MKKWALRLALISFMALAMGEDSCSTETKDQPDKSSKGGAEKSPRAKVGDAITLKGTDTKMKVKVIGVIDPLTAGEFDSPEGGRRFVGVELQLTNVGDTTYDDAPSNGAKLISSRNEQFDSAILSGGECESGFGSSAKIAPGAKRRGCIPFEAKKRAKLKTFQFGLDSGFGPQTGEWSLK